MLRPALELAGVQTIDENGGGGDGEIANPPVSV